MTSSDGESHPYLEDPLPEPERSQFMASSKVKVEEMDEDDTEPNNALRQATPTISKLTFTVDDIPPTKWAEQF